jgi:cyclic pyranopterin phosphate synthase
MKQKDRYGRKINYLRISVTDRCNLRCAYCMPSEGIPLIKHDDILRYEEITRIAYLAHELGFTKFRITGGEPLVRKGLHYLVRDLANLGEDLDLSITTNGILLANQALTLKDAGLKRINISLDTLNREKFKQISRFDLFSHVIEGINKAIEVGFEPIKINVVVVKNINHDEILDFVELTRSRPLWIRFIELMPFSRNNWQIDNFISENEIKKIIGAHYKLLESNPSYIGSPSTDYTIEGHKGRIGFISPISKKFCDLCNRIRLTADGHLLPCLHSPLEIDIRTPIRNGASDEAIKSILQKTMLAKPEGHGLCGKKTEKVGRVMSRVGG